MMLILREFPHGGSYGFTLLLDGALWAEGKINRGVVSLGIERG